MTEIPKALFRNTDFQFAKTFVEEGELLFRPLSYFKTSEGVSGDKHEGQIVRGLAGAKVEMQDPDSLEWINVVAQGGEFIRKIEDHQSDRLLIKCFSLSHQQNNYGKTTIEIFNPAGFLKHLDRALAFLEIDLFYGVVKYYDIKEVIIYDAPAESVWLNKRNDFQSDKEFRLAVYLSKNVLPDYIAGSSIKLKIGSLSQFARVMS